MKIGKLKIAATVTLMLVVGCSSMGQKYKESVVLDPSDAHLVRYSAGYWSAEITDKARKSRFGQDDRFFIVGFLDEDISKYAGEKIYVSKRAAEITLASGHDCLTLFNEEKFKQEFTIDGNGSYTTKGTLSGSGFFSGSIYQTGPVSFNTDTINFGAKGFLVFPGSVLYLVSHLDCPTSVSENYFLKTTVGLSGQSVTNTLVQTEEVFRAADLLKAINKLLSGRGGIR